jgi:hypothetical protein
MRAVTFSAQRLTQVQNFAMLGMADGNNGCKEAIAEQTALLERDTRLTELPHEVPILCTAKYDTTRTIPSR